MAGEAYAGYVGSRTAICGAVPEEFPVLGVVAVAAIAKENRFSYSKNILF